MQKVGRASPIGGGEGGKWVLTQPGGDVNTQPPGGGPSEGKRPHLGFWHSEGGD